MNESLRFKVYEIVYREMWSSFCSGKKGRLSEAYHYPFSPKHDIPKRFKCKCVIKPTRFRLPRYLHVNIVPILVSIATRCFYMSFRVTMKTLNVYEQWNFSLFSLINNEYRRERYDGTQKFTCFKVPYLFFEIFKSVIKEVLRLCFCGWKLGD